MQTARLFNRPQPHAAQPRPAARAVSAQVSDEPVQNLYKLPLPARLQRSVAGTTLVEVVVAVAIIAVMATGLIGSLSYGFLATELARENQRATQILLEKAEVIRLYNWDQFNYTNNFVPATFTAVYDPQAATNNQGITYYGTLALSTMPGDVSYSNFMRQITITLNWTTAGRIPRHRMLTTQIAKDGLQNYVY